MQSSHAAFIGGDIMNRLALALALVALVVFTVVTLTTYIFLSNSATHGLPPPPASFALPSPHSPPSSVVKSHSPRFATVERMANSRISWGPHGPDESRWRR